MLRVRVLGDLAVELDGTAAALPASVKVRGMLAWLALHPGMQPRGTVAARLWPDVLDASARASLRSSIWALRRALGDKRGRLLVATRDQVGLGEPGVEVWVDLLELDRLARAGQPEEALADVCARDMSHDVTFFVHDGEQASVGVAARHADGLRVHCLGAMRVRDGRIVEQTTLQAWDS